MPETNPFLPSEAGKSHERLMWDDAIIARSLSRRDGKAAIAIETNPLVCPNNGKTCYIDTALSRSDANRYPFDLTAKMAECSGNLGECAVAIAGIDFSAMKGSE